MGNKYVKDVDTFSTSQNGVVPSPTQDDITANKVLRADGSWVPQSGGPSVGFGTGFEIHSEFWTPARYYDSTNLDWIGSWPENQFPGGLHILGVCFGTYS